jgi:hypothetical protein
LASRASRAISGEIRTRALSKSASAARSLRSQIVYNRQASLRAVWVRLPNLDRIDHRGCEFGPAEARVRGVLFGVSRAAQ